jgi:hypothetical protein
VDSCAEQGAGISDISTMLILNRPDAPNLQGYFAALLAKEWETQGIRVIIHYDLESSIPADICLVHVDLSVVPAEYLDFARQYPNTINLHITDIRKSSYSRNRVVPGDGYPGPVIVKSSLNCAGEPERRGRPHHRVAEIWREFNRKLTDRAWPSLPFQQPSITSKEHYRVFPKRRMLPVGWLDRDDVVVERFRPEQHGNNFVLREWYFLGDRECYRCEISKDPIFTSATWCPILEAPPPDAIRQVRRELRIDYGKIDYAIDHEGFPVLFDVNKTVGLVNPDSEWARGAAKILAAGLSSLSKTNRWRPELCRGSKNP